MRLMTRCGFNLFRIPSFPVLCKIKKDIAITKQRKSFITCLGLTAALLVLALACAVAGSRRNMILAAGRLYSAWWNQVACSPAKPAEMTADPRVTEVEKNTTWKIDYANIPWEYLTGISRRYVRQHGRHRPC